MLNVADMGRADTVLQPQQGVSLQDGLRFEDVDRGHSGAAPIQAGHERIGLDQFGSGSVDQEGGRLHSGQIFQADRGARCLSQSQVQAQDIALSKQLGSAGGDFVTVGTCALTGGLTAPDKYAHAESAAVTRHDLSDLSVTPDPQRFTFEE